MNPGFAWTGIITPQSKIIGSFGKELDCDSIRAHQSRWTIIERAVKRTSYITPGLQRFITGMSDYRWIGSTKLPTLLQITW